MKNRKISVFVLSRADYIKSMQDEGWTLKFIHEKLQEEFGEEFSFFTFRTAVARARKKIQEKQSTDKKLEKVFNKSEQNIVTKIETNHKENKDAVSKLKEEIEEETNNKNFDF